MGPPRLEGRGHGGLSILLTEGWTMRREAPAGPGALQGQDTRPRRRGGCWSSDAGHPPWAAGMRGQAGGTGAGSAGPPPPPRLREGHGHWQGNGPSEDGWVRVGPRRAAAGMLSGACTTPITGTRGEMGRSRGPVPPDTSVPKAWVLRSYREERGREETEAFAYIEQASAPLRH